MYKKEFAMIKIGLLVSILVLFTACMSEKERMIKDGYPEKYATGYEDGCSTGNSAAGGYGNFKKKIRLFDSNSDYQRGWKEGHAFCFQKEKSNQEAQLQYAIERKLNEKKK